jgi:hypothetical protein
MNRWTMGAKERNGDQKRRPITKENIGNIQYNVFSQGNDFSLDGDDEIDDCG